MVIKTDGRSLQNLINSRHPMYNSADAHWRFVASTYKGGRDWFRQNLFTYFKEGPLEYEDRIKRAYRFNHTREVVDLVDKYLFKQDILRSEQAPQALKDFWKSATLDKQPIDMFALQMSNRSSVYGRVAVVIDSNMPAGIVSEAERKAGDYRIYAYTIEAPDILDYSFDDRGELNWILVREYQRDDENPFDSNKKVQPQYRLWTRNHSLLVKVKSKLHDGATVMNSIRGYEMVEHGLGLVPVVLCDNKIGCGGYEAPGLIDDIAYLDRAVANYLSNLDTIIQDQTYSQLVMPGQGLMPGDTGYDKLIEAGTKRVFTYDGEGGAAPTYIYPDVKQGGLILDVISKIINEIYHSVGLAGERTKQDNAMGIDNSSGVAKAYDFERVNALLVSKASALQLAERKIAQIVAKYAKASFDEEMIIYPESFDARGLYDELDISSRLKELEAPKSLRRVQVMKLVDKLYPHLSADLKAAIKKEVKDEWLEMQDAAGQASNPDQPAGKNADPKRTGQGSNGKDYDDKSKSPKTKA